MDIFLSTHINKIDAKGRVSVPATFRTALSSSATGPATGIIVYRALHHDALEACSPAHLELLSQSMDKLDLTPEAYELIETTIFGGSMHVPMDAEGRMILPEGLRDAAGIKDSAAFVGRRNTFQIWQPAKFTTYMDAQRKQAKAHDISLSKIIADAKSRVTLND
ncbi:MAG: division/cell wall cluster transcriptional repressor MraZ [Bdellovibrionales bacterium]